MTAKAARGVGQLTQRDRRPVPAVPGEVRAVVVLRNEMMRLPRMLDWYRALGVDRFLVVDNNSTDGTADFLLAQPDVHVFHTAGSFAASHCGIAWAHALLDAYCDGHWTLVVDADELFVYPDCERAGIGRLVRHLDATGAQGLFAVLVDMYAAGPIADARLAPDATLLSACPHFDPGPYRAIASRVFPHRELRGGPRARVFMSATGDLRPPTMNKIPFLRWHRGIRLTPGQHTVSLAITLAGLTGALLHFKFLADFHEKALREATRGEHHDGGSEYRAYAALMTADPALGLHYAGSLTYEDSASLTAARLMQDTPAWRAFVAAEQTAATRGQAQALS